MQRFLSERPDATAFEMIEEATRVVGSGNFFAGLIFLFRESSFRIKCHTIVKKPDVEHPIQNLRLDDRGTPIDHGLASQKCNGPHGDETRYWLITIRKRKRAMIFEHPMYLYADGLSFIAELSEDLMLPDGRYNDASDRDRFLWPIKVPAPIEVEIGPFSKGVGKIDIPNEFGTAACCEQSTMALLLTTAMNKYSAGVTKPAMVNSLTPRKTLPDPDMNCVKVVMESMIDGLGVNLIRVPKDLHFSNFLKKLSCPDFPLTRVVDPFTYIEGKIEFHRPTAKEKSHNRKTFPCCRYQNSFLEVTEADRAKARAAKAEPTGNETDYRSANSFSYEDCDVYFATRHDTIWIKKDIRLAILRALFSQASPQASPQGSARVFSPWDDDDDVQRVRDAMVNATFFRTEHTEGREKDGRDEKMERIEQAKRFAVERIIVEYIQKLFEAIGKRNIGPDFTTTIYLEVINRYRYDLTRVVHYGTNGVFFINLPGLTFVRDYYRGQKHRNELVYAEDIESLTEDNDLANDNLGFDVTKIKSLVSLPPSTEINPEIFDEMCEEKMRACVRPASKDRNEWAEDITAKKICHPKGYRLKVNVKHFCWHGGSCGRHCLTTGTSSSGSGYYRVFKMKTKEWYALTRPKPSCFDILERPKDELDFLELMMPDFGYVREVMQSIENLDRDRGQANEIDENQDRVNETNKDKDLVGLGLPRHAPQWPNQTWTGQEYGTLPRRPQFPCYIMHMNQMNGIKWADMDIEEKGATINARLNDAMNFLRDESITPFKIIDNIMKNLKRGRRRLDCTVDKYNQRIQMEIAIGMYKARKQRLGDVLNHFPKEG